MMLSVIVIGLVLGYTIGLITSNKIEGNNAEPIVQEINGEFVTTCPLSCTLVQSQDQTKIKCINCGEV